MKNHAREAGGVEEWTTCTDHDPSPNKSTTFPCSTRITMGKRPAACWAQ